MMFQNKF